MIKVLIRIYLSSIKLSKANSQEITNKKRLIITKISYLRKMIKMAEKPMGSRILLMKISDCTQEMPVMSSAILS